jgi:pimeloyl-ACP methyl ester carboxylesterase
MHDPQHIKTLDLYPGIPISFMGPPLNEGPLPALFYFALAAHESLGVDPYNQPAVYLSSLPLRIFSIDIPGHGKELSSQDALGRWTDIFQQGTNLIAESAERVSTCIADLIVKNIIIREKCAVAGLSRGAFLATHVAARCADVRWILGFAPLTKLSFAKEFDEIKDSPAVRDANLENLTPLLLERTLRFYIGNCDQRVGTRNCFDFIEKLSQEMYAARIRSPTVELFINPSIGFQGHGTAKHIFHHGAQWLASQLGVIDVY